MKKKSNELRKRRTSDGIEVTIGSGNVFADLGLPDPEALLIKAQLAGALGDVVRRRKLKQADAAKILGVDQAKVSKLMNGRLDLFSIDKLMKLLVKAGKEIDIVIRDRPKRAAKGRESMRVIAAA